MYLYSILCTSVEMNNWFKNKRFQQRFLNTKRIQEYKGIQGDTREYKGIQGDTREYKGKNTRIQGNVEVFSNNRLLNLQLEKYLRFPVSKLYNSQDLF